MVRKKSNKIKENLRLLKNGNLEKQIEQLHVGQEFKNYPELCKALNLEPDGGNKKKKQLKELQSYINYEVQDRKYIITEIFETPKVLEQKVAANAKYVNFVQNILLSYLSKQKEEVAYVTQQNLWTILGMVNERYFPMRESKEELLALDENMDIFNINNFYQRSNLKFRDIIKSSIASLKRRKIIMCEETYRIGIGHQFSSTFESIEYHDASDSEKRYILRTQHNLLKKYGCKDEFELFFKKNKDSYYKELNEIFLQDKGWKNVFFCYKLVFDKDIVVEEINEQEEVLQFNNIIIETLDTQADTIYTKKGITANNAGERYLHERNPFFYFEDYPRNQKILSENLIRKQK